MVLLILILSCMIAGSLACDIDCKDPALINEVLRVTEFPNEEELRTLCPKVKTVLECEKDTMECRGQSIDELVTSTNKFNAANAKALLGANSLVSDICDEDSTFHAEYVASVNCYREYLIGAFRNCRENIVKPIDDFLDQLYADDDKDNINEARYKDLRCLTHAYETACVIDNLGDACGDVAQRIARDALGRLKAILGLSSCKFMENAADLKSRFFDFLKLNGHKSSNVTKEILDLYTRRR